MSITLWESLARQTEAMAHNAFAGLHSLADWERVRAARHAEYLQALGLGCLPARCDPDVREYGEFHGEGFRGRKLGFQILPDCWSSAIFYYPEPLPPGRHPAVLYVCGHATNGNAAYRSFGQCWARRGYVCLVLDTIEQADNPGEHHGHSRHWGNEWIALGYSSAGGETFNSIRALDLLAEDPSVDPARIGVTGQSGGGALSFHLAIADERIRAVSSWCGVSTPLDAVRNRHVAQNCDCFYPINLHRRDLAEYAALIAPRAAMFCCGDHDPLFHPGEVRAFVERTRSVFRWYGHEEDCRLIACPGPHGSHPEFETATAELFDRCLAGRPMPALARGTGEGEERALSIFNGTPPSPNRLDLLPQLLSPRGSLPLPADADDWRAIRRRALDALPFPADDGTPAQMQPDGDWRWGPVESGTAIRAHRGSIGGMEVWLHAVNPPEAAPRVVIGVAGAGESSLEAMCAVAVSLEKGITAYGGFEPRAAGNNLPPDEPDAFPPGSRLHSSRKLLLRAMSLAGQTPALMTFQDTGLLVDYLTRLPEMQGREIYLHGRGMAAVAVLYRGIVDERVAGVFLEDLPGSHRDACPLPGILRVLDLPQAVGLMAPRKVALIRPGHEFWSWSERVYARLGCPDHRIWVDDCRHAMARLFAAPA